MKKRQRPYGRFLPEDCDLDSALSNQECEIYALVDFFVRERARLMSLVLEARSKANDVAHRRTERPYPDIGENLFNACFEDHPAMGRYYDLYGDNAFDGRC